MVRDVWMERIPQTPSLEKTAEEPTAMGAHVEGENTNWRTSPEQGVWERAGEDSDSWWGVCWHFTYIWLQWMDMSRACTHGEGPMGPVWMQGDIWGSSG